MFSKAEGLISSYLGPPKAEREEQSYFNFCTSISYGEIFCSRRTTGILRDNLTKQVSFPFFSRLLDDMCLKNNLFVCVGTVFRGSLTVTSIR